MKIYRLILPDGSKHEKTFADKREATNAMYAYITNHPRDGYTPFDFQLEEKDVQNPESITSYITARKVIGSTELSKIAVDDENKEILGTIDFLLTMARAWNKADAFDPYADNPSGTFCPSFIMSEHGSFELGITRVLPSDEFTINRLISFRTEDLATAFGETFISQFKQLFTK